MDRTLFSELVAWRDSARRKPLVLNGARQVGKTWLLRRFGKECYGSVAYVNLDMSATAARLFEGDQDPRRIIEDLSVYLGMDIEPADTLVILDEIQAVPRAITSLKYFAEYAPEYHVAAAGSLLGLSASQGTGWPVGKVDELNLYPLTFEEFLAGTGRGRLVALLAAGEIARAESFKLELVAALREYCVVGGMPEVVAAYSEDGDFAMARRIQETILHSYANDFTKHVPPRTLQYVIEAFNSIPAHLSQENKKFVFGRIRSGARAKTYEEALLWLAQAGLVTRVDRVSKPGMPLSAYVDWKAFKVFLLDIGLLGAMSGLDPASVVEGNSIFTEFKGAMAEQCVCQQLVGACGLRPFYWSSDTSTGELDFLVQTGGVPVAIEVKAEENLRAKSLRNFIARHPEVRAVRFSMSDLRDEGWMENVPLWAVGAWGRRGLAGPAVM